MKEADLLPISAKLSGAGAESALFGRGRYKFWALAVIILLAFWSMLAGTVTLKWSAGNLNGISGDIDSISRDDLDVLEVEEREKVVRHMWDVYTHSRRIRLPRFWQEAFEAAYEDLASDEADVRDDAVAEIARMSMGIVDLEPPTRQTKKLETNTVYGDDGDGMTKSKSKISTTVDAR
ncbi:hypothetical protein AXF42_Ash013467 [Apostasia shenzhenica]|uniref:Uncharacterized protein n=1 Tax=Apostasia shenzhenica TaxID=1088818 RepID=A0A2I0A4B4_9ASPA|nr:hypothetical protein AXF42_Ash013467 [Apostasia shenzhenica]